MKSTNETMFNAVKSTAMGRVMQFKTPLGHKIILMIYALAQNIFSFN